MKYSEFIRQKQRQGKPPTLKPLRLNPEQQDRAEKGICIHCGINPAGKTSYLCAACESETGRSISSDIDNARKKCLANHDRSDR
ncbi:MAG: hypothetical protein KKH68_07900 [Proteobacteria bacterium]|nr:hypothetical protein [Pseudomonadota bacterium]